MNKKLRKIYEKFIEEFGYAPEFPMEINFNQEEYGNILAKCIEDKFDYTIEKYGTIPGKPGYSDVLID